MSCIDLGVLDTNKSLTLLSRSRFAWAMETICCSAHKAVLASYHDRRALSGLHTVDISQMAIVSYVGNFKSQIKETDLVVQLPLGLGHGGHLLLETQSSNSA